MLASRGTNRQVNTSGDYGVDDRKGVYALIMALKTNQRIKVGRLGTFDFPAGWYVYLGSAHGGGGLMARTDRHKRQDKRKHWHVDYFRDFAAIHEIWFSHEPHFREHDWARTIARMAGASSPVHGFGAADCTDACSAHFYHFDRRPFPTAFRGALRNSVPEHTTVYVEFLVPHVKDRTALASGSTLLVAAYDRGRRFLDARRAADDGLAANASNSPLTTFSKDNVSSSIVRQLASELRVNEQELKGEAKFAEAVDDIVWNCGGMAFEVLLRADVQQDRESIMKLSRKSLERQQYRIEGVAAGRMLSVGPQGSDRVPDTKTFQKINSRLARARGSIVCCQNVLSAHGCRALSSDVQADIKKTARKCGVNVRSFAKLLSKSPVNYSLEPVLAKPVRRAPESKLGLAAVPRQLKSGLSMIEKNIRDLPASSYDLRPTEHELEVAKQEIATIQKASRGIILLVGQ